MKRWIPLTDDKIQFETKGPVLELTLPQETFLLDGIQIIKGAVSNEIFKYIPSIKTVRFIEEHVNQEDIQKENKDAKPEKK
jgi:peptidylprolyl isomerase